MDSQIRISDLENIISEKVFIKIEKWNLYLGDAGLARHLAIECISNKDQGPLEAAKISLKAINVKVGDGCLLYTSPSPRDFEASRMPSSA